MTNLNPIRSQGHNETNIRGREREGGGGEEEKRREGEREGEEGREREGGQEGETGEEATERVSVCV